MTIAEGIVKQTRFKRQSAQGTIAGTSDGQIMRRESSTFELAKETFGTDAEITSHQQLTSMKHGARTVNGKLTGIFTPGTYADVIAAMVRRDFTAVSAEASNIVTTAAVTSGAAGTFTRASGSFLTAGLKVGMVVRWTGWATTGVPNNGHNFLITSLTATVMTGIMLNGVAVGAKASGDTVVCTPVGKLTFVPATGHTNAFYTVEEWSPDISVSEVSFDLKVSSIALSMPGSGNAKIDLSMVGLSQNDPASSVYFTSPASETTTSALAGSSGVLFVDGVSQATITDMSCTIDGATAVAEPVTGSNTRPGVFRGIVKISGSFTAYHTSSTIPNMFANETAISLLNVLTDSLDPAADFVSTYLPRVKLTSNTPTDATTGRKRTYNFTAEYNSAGGAALATNATSFQMQDSQAA